MNNPETNANMASRRLMLKRAPVRPDLEEALCKVRHVRMHNSFFGHCAMGRSQMRAIQEASSTSPAAKDKASLIFGQLGELAELLKVRIDP